MLGCLRHPQDAHSSSCKQTLSSAAHQIGFCRAWVPQSFPEESCRFCCCKPEQLGPDRERQDSSRRTVADQIGVIWVIRVPKVRHLPAQHVVGDVQPLQLRKHWLNASGKLVSRPAAWRRTLDQLSYGHHAVLRATASAAGPVWDDVHTVQDHNLSASAGTDAHPVLQKPPAIANSRRHL